MDQNILNIFGFYEGVDFYLKGVFSELVLQANSLATIMFIIVKPAPRGFALCVDASWHCLRASPAWHRSCAL